MMKTKDLSNQRFGLWKVLYQVEDNVTPKGIHQPMWMCECQCEKHTKKIVNGYSLKRGETKSCGCLTNKLIKDKNSRQNIYKPIDDECYIGYTQSNKEFYFDKEDFELVKQYCWDIDSSNGYVKTIDNINNTGKLYLHRLIMGCKKNDGITIDHINRNRVDCRKNNLRIVTRCQNNMNMAIRCDNTSGRKGVHYNKLKNKWEAKISVNKKKIWLGSYEEFEDAVRAREEAEEKYFGEYNTIN